MSLRLRSCLPLIACAILLVLPSAAGAANLGGGPSWLYEPEGHTVVGSVAGGVVVVAENPTAPGPAPTDYRLRGLSVDDGSVLWTISGYDFRWVEPIGDSVLVTHQDRATGQNFAVLRNPSSGDEIWSYELANPGNERPIDDFDRVWVSINPGKYQALNMATGEAIGALVSSASLPVKSGDHAGGITINAGHAYNRYSTQPMPAYDARTIVGDGPFKGLVTAGMENLNQFPQWKVPAMSVRSPGSATVRRGFQNGFELSKLVGSESGLIGHTKNLTGNTLVGFGPGPNCNVPGPYRANLGDDIVIDVADLCAGNPTSVGGTVRSWVGTTATYDGTTMTIKSPAQAGTGAIIAEVHDAEGNMTLIVVRVRFGLDIAGCAFSDVSRGAGGEVQAFFGCELLPPGTDLVAYEYPGGETIANGAQVTYTPELGETGKASIQIVADGVDPQVWASETLRFTLSEHGFCLDKTNSFSEYFVSFLPRCFGESALTLASASTTTPEAIDVTTNGGAVEVELIPEGWGQAEGRSLTFTMTDTANNILNGNAGVGVGSELKRCPVQTFADNVAGEIAVEVVCEGPTIDSIEDTTPANAGFEAFDMSYDGGTISTTARIDTSFDGVIKRTMWVTYHNSRGYSNSQTVEIEYEPAPSAPVCGNRASAVNVAGEVVALTAGCAEADGTPRVLLNGSIQRCGPYLVGCASVPRTMNGVIGTTSINYVVVDGQGVATAPRTWTITTAPSAASDSLYGTAASNVVSLRAGNDKFNGMGGADRLYGDSGVDSLVGGAGDDRLYGGLGADTLVGSDGADMLDGSDGNDTIRGDRGRDRIFSGNGSDVVYARDGYADSINCGSGYDRVQADLRDSVSSSCESVVRRSYTA